MIPIHCPFQVRYHTLKPFCIYTGNRSAPIYKWLSDNEVSFIYHQPTWADTLWDAAKPFSQERSKTSMIYSSMEVGRKCGLSGWLTGWDRLGWLDSLKQRSLNICIIRFYL